MWHTLAQEIGNTGISRKGLCGGLKENGYIIAKGSGTVRRCGLVGAGEVLLKEVCHCGGRL